MAGNFYRNARLLILMYILLMVGIGSWLTGVRAHDWNESLRVTAYPLYGDNSEATKKYVERLSGNEFQPIEAFMRLEASRRGVSLPQPFRIQIARAGHELPPILPREPSMVRIALWSLKLRYWSWQMQNKQDMLRPDIQMFVIYHDPDRITALPHSLGLEKGMVGVVNAYATRLMAGSNNVVIAHELLHTLGATDKYSQANNHPVYPAGYAEPYKRPLHPQRKAELMGGRIPVSKTERVMPTSLKRVVIGPQTALEINWLTSLPDEAQLASR